MMKNCLRCHHAHTKCIFIGESKSCLRCKRCMFNAYSGRHFVFVLSRLPQHLVHCQRLHCRCFPNVLFLHGPIHLLPQQTPQIVYVPQPSHSLHNFLTTRLIYLVSGLSAIKKYTKQEKFLEVMRHEDVNVSLTTADIKNEVIVFDGTASHPPQVISSPSKVSNISFITFSFFANCFCFYFHRVGVVSK